MLPVLIFPDSHKKQFDVLFDGRNSDALSAEWRRLHGLDPTNENGSMQVLSVE